MNRRSLCFIALAGILDAVLTDIGLRHHIIGEANPLMLLLYSNAYISYYVVKVLLPVPLFLLKSGLKNLRFATSLFRLSVAVYAFVLALHVCWISAYLVTA